MKLLRLVLLLSVLVPSLMAVSSARAQVSEPRPVKIRLYRSLIPGVSESQARGVTKPMIELLSRKVDYPLEFDFAKGSNPEDLLAFGEKVHDGTYHFGVVWGLEFGWLLKEYPNLKAMALASNGARFFPYRSQLMIRRQDTVPKFDQLKGKKLAHYKGEPLMERLFVDDMLRKKGHDPDGFFVHEKPQATVKDAIYSVKDGQADCVMVNSGTFVHLEAVQPNVVKALMNVEESQPYPAPVVIGSLQHVEELRTGLWRRLQEELFAIHHTPEGEQCVLFWRVDSFVEPSTHFQEQVEKCARDFPIEHLLRVK